jgi:hypothetical protein
VFRVAENLMTHVDSLGLHTTRLLELPQERQKCALATSNLLFSLHTGFKAVKINPYCRGYRLVGEPRGKSTLERSRCRSKNNTKWKINGMKWSGLDLNKWLALVNAILNLNEFHKMGVGGVEFLITWATASFSILTLLHRITEVMVTYYCPRWSLQIPNVSGQQHLTMLTRNVSYGL